MGTSFIHKQKRTYGVRVPRAILRRYWKTVNPVKKPNPRIIFQITLPVQLLVSPLPLNVTPTPTTAPPSPSVHLGHRSPVLTAFNYPLHVFVLLFLPACAPPSVVVTIILTVGMSPYRHQDVDAVQTVFTLSFCRGQTQQTHCNTNE